MGQLLHVVTFYSCIKMVGKCVSKCCNDDNCVAVRCNGPFRPGSNHVPVPLSRDGKNSMVVVLVLDSGEGSPACQEHAEVSLTEVPALTAI